MTNNPKIYIKLQLEKDPEDQKLYIKAHFDDTAPNFHYSNDEISWVPTTDELDFIKESFDMLSTLQKK